MSEGRAMVYATVGAPLWVRPISGPSRARVPWRVAAPLVLLALLASLLPLVARMAEPALAPTHTDASTALTDAEEASIAEQIEAARLHFVTGDRPGTLHVANPDAGIAATVTAETLTIAADSPDADPITFTTQAFGRHSATSPLVVTSAPAHTDTVATIQRGPVVEWFQNGPGGLQQGWTVATRPAGAGELALDLSISGATVTSAGEDALSLAPASGPALQYSGLTAFDADGTHLPVRFDLTASGVRITVDDAAAEYPVVIDPVLSAVEHLEGVAVATGANFGWAVDMDGRWMVVSALNDHRAPAPSPQGEGAVYVYFDETGQGEWSLVDRLFAPVAGTAVGNGVAIDVEPEGVTVVAAQMGFARLLAWTYAGDPTTVAPTQTPVGPQIITSQPWPGRGIGNYGWSLALDQGTLVVGAPRSRATTYYRPDGPDLDDAPDVVLEDVGLVEVLNRSGGFGTPFGFSQRLHPPAGLQEVDPELRDIAQEFGYSVAIEGELIAVGARGADLVRTPTGGSTPETAVEPGQSTFEGAIDVFRLDGGGTWQHRQRVTQDARLPNMGLGTSVALADGDIVGGGPGANVAGQAGNVGTAYLFEHDPGTDQWSESHQFDADDPTTSADESTTSRGRFGSGVDVTEDGRRIYIGAPAVSTPDQPAREGAVYVFERSGTGPTDQPQLVTLLGPADHQVHAFTGQSFGEHVAASGDSLVASSVSGTFGAGARSGSAHTFHARPDGFDPGTRHHPLGERWNAHFGWSMARDGDVLVVSAPEEIRWVGSPANNGAVYVFIRSGSGEWALEEILVGNHGVAPNNPSRIGPIDVWVERDAEGNDTGLVVAMGIPDDHTVDPDGRGDPSPPVEWGSAIGSVGVMGRSGGPGTTYDVFGKALWSGGHDGWGLPNGVGIYPGTITDDGRFGESVAFADDGTLYVGEPGADGGRGAVHRFEQPAQPATRAIAPFRYDYAATTAGPVGDTGFGTDLAAEATAVVASSRADNGSLRASVLSDGDRVDPEAGRNFVTSLSFGAPATTDLDIAGGRIAIGSGGDGAARVYRSPGHGGAYELEGVMSGDPATGFGSEVALSRGSAVLSVAIASPLAPSATVHVARVRPGGRARWTEAATLTPPTDPGTGSGSAVSLVHWPDDGGTFLGLPGWDDPDVEAGRAFRFDTSGIVEPDGPAAFVDVADIGSVPVGASYLPTAGLPPSLLTNAAKTEGSIAAASIGDVDLAQPPTGTSVAASPLSSLPLSSLPLSSLDLQGAPLSSLPLSSLPLSSLPLSLPGGWEALLAGTAFAGVPTQSVMFADVVDLPQVQALTVGQVGLSASPLSSLPLSSLALGATPLSSLPIGDGDPVADWCAAVTDLGYEPSPLGLDCSDPDNPANDDVNLVSLGLAGVPLSSLPLSSLPLSSLPLSSLPLSSLPLSSLDIAGSPLSSLPLSSLPLSSLPLSSLPLSSLPLSSLPLSSLPLSSLDIAGSPLSSLPLSSLPLSSLPLSSLPLSSLPLSSLPLSSLPLSSLVLAGAPLSSLPLSSLDVASTPLSSLPLSSLPLSSLPLSSLPLSSLPLSSLPLSSLPLSSLEIAGSPLSSLPLSSLAHPVTGVLRSAPLSSLPLSSLPLSSLATFVDCDLIACDRPDVTLGDAARAGALDLGLTLGDLGSALTGVRLGDIGSLISGVTLAEVQASLAGFTLADLDGSYDDLTLGEVPSLHAFLTLGAVVGALDGARLGDIAEHIDGFSADDVIAMLVDSGLHADVLTGFDDVTLGEAPALAALLQFADIIPGLSGFRLSDLVGVIAKPGGGTYSEAELRQAVIDAMGADATLGDLGDLDDLTLGELAEYGGLSLGELLTSLPADVLDDLRLDDLILMLIARSQYPWQHLDLDRVVTQALDSGDASVPVSVAFRADAPDGAARTVRIELRPPFGSRLVPDSVALSLPVPVHQLAPQILDGAFVWTFTDVPANAPHSLTLAMEPTMAIGADQLQAVATILEDDEAAVDRTDIEVTEVLEPNDTTAQASALPDDTIVLSHISSPGDLDVFAFDVTVPGSRVSINLSNLDHDLDAVLYSPKASSADIQEPSARSIVPVEDEDQSAIAGFSESGPEPADDLAAPVDLGELAVNQASINRGTRDEQIDTGVLSRTGTYYLAVSGYNGATTRQPYALRLKRLDPLSQPPCPAREVSAAGPTASLPTTLPAGTNTVFLVNRSRMNALYGVGATDQVMASLQALIDFVGAPGQGGLGVQPAVIPVDADPGVRAALQAWDAQPCLVEGANGVVAEIVRVLDGYRTAGAAIEQIVVVGGDDVLPFARVPDRTEVANEGEYAATFSDAGNALYATFATESVLTDDAYGDIDPYGFGDRVLFVPNAAVGRLVETPAEIADQLADFVAAQGLLDVGTGLATGYDFLIDGASAVTDELADTYGTVDTSLISDTWTRQDLEDAIAAIEPDVASINAHFDHFRALPGLGNSTGDESDLFTAAAVRGSLAESLAGSVVFSMGCHGGLNVSDKLYGDHRALDFAQAISSQGGVFVGNTGYGYGDTELVALSERLMTYFAERLDGSLSVGEALLYAKAEYAADLTAYGVYDEKAMMEATFYGLPFYRLAVADPPEPPALPDALVVNADPITGIDTSTLTVTPVHEHRTGSDGEEYVVGVDPETGEELVTAVHDRPVQPRAEVEFTAPDGSEAHDALVLGLTSTDEHGVDPYVFEPVTDSDEQRTGATVDVVFPSSPARINPQQVPGGDLFTLSATTGHFRTTSSDGSGVQRLYDSMTVSAHFADAGSSDFTRPTFGRVDATASDGTLTFEVAVTDDQAGARGVRRVYVLAVEEPEPGVTATWRGLDLVPTPGTDRWTGSMAIGADDVEYLVQAVDAAGNVGITTNKALNFRDAALPLDPPRDDLEVSLDGTQGAAGWYTSDVQLTATGGSSLTVEIVGSARQPYLGPVVLTDDGAHTVIVRSADGQRITTTVRIDQHGPSAIVLAPTPGTVVRQGAGIGAMFACPDAGSGAVSCSATLDGQAVDLGDDVTGAAGSHTLVVTAGGDQAGNGPTTATATSTFVVVPDVDVTSVEVLSTSGATTSVAAHFRGHSVGAPYTAVFDWDDGTTTTCGTDSSEPGCSVVIGADGNGTATATRTYDAVASRTIAVTVTDRLGGSDTGTVTVNRTTAMSATSVLVKLKLIPLSVKIQVGSISATLTDDDGNPLSGRSVRFTALSGADLCTATTNSAGVAGCTGLTLTLAAVLSGGYRATYHGGDGYLGVSTTAPIAVVG